MKTLLIAALVLGALELPIALHESTWRMNWTSSVPIGLYRAQTEPGQYLVFCLAAEPMKTALTAGMTTGRGECADGRQPLLKTVYQASVQCPVTLAADGFTVGGRLLPNTAPKAYSKSGKALQRYGFGTYTSGLWAVSSYNPDSYDSRYFGPVAPESIRFYAHPVFTF